MNNSQTSNPLEMDLGGQEEAISRLNKKDQEKLFSFLEALVRAVEIKNNPPAEKPKRKH